MTFLPANPCHPTIGELVPQYTQPPGAISKKRAVRYIVDSHLRSRLARGHGNKAARRQAMIEMYAELDRGLGRLSERDVDALAERDTESRTYQRSASLERGLIT